MKYETIWRGKFITQNVNSFDDLIRDIKDEMNTLKAMKEDGVGFDFSGADDDYIQLSTNDKKIADKWNFKK